LQSSYLEVYSAPGVEVPVGEPRQQWHWFPSSICLPSMLCLLPPLLQKQISFCFFMGQALSLVKFEKESLSVPRRGDVRVKVEKNV